MTCFTLDHSPSDDRVGIWAKQLALLPAKRDHRVGLLHFPVARDDPLCLPPCMVSGAPGTREVPLV